MTATVANQQSGAPQRVAVITVHGIADQQPGQTVRELARLLSHGAEGEPAYGKGEAQVVLMSVGPLAPQREHTVPPLGSSAEAGAKRAGPRPRAMPGTPSDFYRSEQAPEAGVAPPPAADARPRAAESEDLGLRLTDYLLSRYRPAERDALYESTRISLARREGGLPVDLYELYWADYSRLKPGGVRALSASYQLFFHLITLARDVIEHVLLAEAAHRPGPAWRLLHRLHAWSAWLQKGPAALLQLAMLLTVLFGAAGLLAQEYWRPALQVLGAVVAAALGVSALLAALARPGADGPPGGRSKGRALAALLGAAAGVALAVSAALLDEAGMQRLYVTVAASLVLVLGVALLRRYGRTVRGIQWFGYLVFSATTALLLTIAWRVLPHVTTGKEWLATTALNAGEWLLAALLVAWAALAITQSAAVVAGMVLGRGESIAVRQSVRTARMAMVCSTALFALLSLVLWSIVAFIAALPLGDVRFVPQVFGDSYVGAGRFLEYQVGQVGALFTPLLAMTTGLGALALVALLPSLREEIAPTLNRSAGQAVAGAARWSHRLGRWLDRALTWIGALFGTVVPLLAVAGSAFYLVFAVQVLLFDLGLYDWMQRLNGDLLLSAGKWLAGGAVTISALGTRFTDTFGRLRVVLDAVLDVDNYFRDPADRQPPRARIFSRYAALLEHVCRAGYARVIIVAHSQGTVISADLLRYLHRHDRLGPLADRLALVTVGSPLRDLYAARFPLLYSWMTVGSPQAPAPSMLGLRHWVNAYRSGDYVGRAIWAPRTAADVYAPAEPGGFSVHAGRIEFCLGAGAHTHYFSNDAVALADALDRLIVGTLQQPTPKVAAPLAQPG